MLLQCRLGKCDLVVVDYLHLLGGDRRKGETQEQMVGRNVRALKQLALDSNCPVLTVSQMNRACEARADKAYLPVMSDLRDSGTIEQVADCVAFIYRPERYGFTRDEKTGHSLVKSARSISRRTVTVRRGSPVSGTTLRSPVSRTIYSPVRKPL